MHAGAHHRIKQRPCTVHVDVIISAWRGDRLPHIDYLGFLSRWRLRSKTKAVEAVLRTARGQAIRIADRRRVGIA